MKFAILFNLIIFKSYDLASLYQKTNKKALQLPFGSYRAEDFL